MTITFRKLVALEPRLAAMLEEAKAIKFVHYFCANATWFNVFNERLAELVGRERADRHKQLSTRKAYDCAFDTIYNALPDCTGCDCL